MIVAGIEFPDSCPGKCKMHPYSFIHCGQSSPCMRCPIFNCGGSVHLIEPKDYREDWAKEWKRFFDGEVDFPQLPLKMRKE